MGDVVQSVLPLAAAASFFIPGVGPFIALGLTALSVVSGLLFANKPKSPKIDLPSTARDRIENIRSSTDSHIVVYGTTRVAVRPWVFVESTGSDSRFIHLIGPVAGHEVDDITHLILDDETLEWGVGVNDTTGKVSEAGNRRFSQPSDATPPVARAFKHLGSDGQVADAIAVSELTNWTALHRGRGLAYVYLRFRYHKTIFQNGVPKTSVIARGRRVWDPRDGDQDFDDSSTHVFSNNWALCVLDYLTNTSFGLGARQDEIDESSFIAAANVADEQVETGVGGSPSQFQARYTCDGVVDTADDPIDIMDKLLSGGAGALSYSQGKYYLFAGSFVTPSKTLTSNDLAGDLEVQPKQPRSQLFNAVRGTFVNPDDNYQPTDFPPRTNSLYEEQDGGFQIFRDIELPFTQDSVRAQRIAEIVIRKSRQGITVKFPAKLTALNIAVFDSVKLTLNDTGANLGWDEKVFRVLGMEISEEFQEGVILTLQEDDSTSYEWDGGTVLTFDPAPDTTLPDPFTIPAPSNVAFASGDAQLFVAGDGTVRPRVKVTWDEIDNIFVVEGGEIEIQYRDALFGGSPLDWSDGNTQVKLVRGELTVAYLTDVEDGATYDIRLRSRTRIGAVSDQDDEDAEWQQTFQHMVSGKSGEPSRPDTFTVNRLADGTRQYRFTHASPPLDLSGYRIKYSTSSTDWDVMTLLNTTGVITESPIEANEPAAGTYNFAIKSVDTSGNESEDTRLATGVVLGDPRLKNVILQRIEHQLLWPGTITNGFIDDDGGLKSGSSGGWDNLPGGSPQTWGDVADSWNDILSADDPLVYETPEIDIESVVTFTPLITPAGTGTATVTMRTGGEGSPQIEGAYGPLETTSARYVQFRIEVASGVSPQTAVSLDTLTIFLDGDIRIEAFENIDTSGADTENFERIAAGHFRVAPSSEMSSIIRAGIVALQNVGAGYSWELLSKQAGAFGSPGQLAAEFKIYDSTNTLADATVDVEIKGPSNV